MPLISALALSTVVAVPPVPVITETQVLDAPSPTVSPTFGIIVGISGDRIFATGPDPSRSGGSVGQVATFELEPTGSWKAFKEMLSIDGTPVGNMVIGRAVMGGNALIVSDERRDGGNSSVVTFERGDSASGWRLMGRLQPLASAAEPAFGGVIATDGVVAAISTVDMRVLGEAPRTVQASPKVYLFKNGPEGWKGLGYIQRDEALQPKFFGVALSMTPGQVVVGCPNAITAAPHQELVTGGESVVVIYRMNEQGLWAVDGELRPPPGYAEWLGFGTTLASDANTVVVRMSKVTGPGGKIFVYRRGATGWTLDGDLTPLSDVIPGAGWGISLAMADGRAVVGDPTALGGQAPGYVGAFSRRDDGLWGESVRFKSTVSVSTARWGVGLRADGPRVVVARPMSERDGVVTGGALLFTLPPSDKTPAIVPTGLVPTATQPLDRPVTSP
ncbi:MAG: hypothetical protein EXS03_03785 [Phycisphaerales bacterium]|nr:hypothetical protein [Phycisphaerales bacterium]